MSKKFAPNPTASLRRVQSVRTGVSLSDIKQMAVQDIRTNPQNIVYFIQESDEYFRRLREDIEKRGVVVPLLVRQDGVLLAGHNRLQIAREIGLRFVPVQMVQEELTERQEQEFIINDNLLRRHLTNEERIRLYKLLFPEFDAVLASGKRGGDKKSAGFKAATTNDNNQNDNVSLKLPHKNQRQKATTIQELAENIAVTTGQNVATVKQQMTRAKRKSVGKSSINKSGSNTRAAEKNQNDNVSLIKQLDAVLQEISAGPASVQAKAKRILEKFLTRH
jgi:hypothetical protein